MNLPELSLKVGNTLFLLLGIPQLVGSALSASDYYKITRLSVMLQKQNNQAVIIHHRQLTMSALLMVMMLVCKARMSSLSSNQSSCQGV
jgi:hypothetical protein